MLLNKGKKAQPVRKPYLKGRAVSALSARRGLRVLAYLAISAVMFLFLGQMLAMETAWLRILLNLLVISAFCLILFNEGARVGEGDVSFAEIALRRSQEGRETAPGELARCYHKGKGFFTAAAGALPLVLLCLAYAVMATEGRIGLGPLPSWLGAYETRADLSLALSYYHERAAVQAADVLRLLTRLLVFPFVNLAGADNRTALLWVDRLSPLLVLLAPMAYGVGYLQGERFRAMIHGGIAASLRKAARRKQRKAKPARPEPRQLV